MPLQITQICFHQSDYVTLHSDMNIYDRKRLRESFKLLLSGTCWKSVKPIMTDFEVWLSCYIYIFAILTYLTTVNQCVLLYA